MIIDGPRNTARKLLKGLDGARDGNACST